jgi:ribosomal protein S12 methylthiotransferase
MGASAYVKIADGCDAHCAFCAIPLIKGRQRSKPFDAVTREVEELVAAGVREIVLIAQDTTAYGRDLDLSDALPDLLRAIVGAAPQLDWLRLMYAYPQHVTERLIQAMAELPQVCHYLDLPLQHGHADVLRRMRRPHDIESVYGLIARLRQAMPDLALRSTFIVGFPGETEAEFEGLWPLCVRSP